MIKIIFLIFIFLYCANSSFAQNGIRKMYYAKGKLESAVSFSNEILDGTSKWFYENGNIRAEKTFSSGLLNGWLREYYRSGLLKEEHFVRDGVLDGISKKYFDNGALQYVKVFDEGKLQSSKVFGYDSLFVATMDLFVGRSKKMIKKNENLFLCNIDVCPEPIGGIESIEKAIMYPQEDMGGETKGVIVVSTLVNKRGNTEKIVVLKGLSKLLDKAVIDTIKRTKFIPGKNKNRIVDAQVTFSINIK